MFECISNNLRKRTRLSFSLGQGPTLGVLIFIISVYELFASLYHGDLYTRDIFGVCKPLRGNRSRLSHTETALQTHETRVTCEIFHMKIWQSISIYPSFLINLPPEYFPVPDGFTHLFYYARISNHMFSKVWDQITFPYPNFNVRLHQMDK